MAKIGENLPDPNDAQSIVEYLAAVQREVDGHLEFGHPQDPTDDSSTTLAGSTVGAHPGTSQNIRGSWVELSVGTSDLASNGEILCYHNLDVTVAVSGQPNVRWFVAGWYTGDTTPADATAVSVFFVSGDTVAANSIGLRVGATGITVSDAVPLRVSLFFIPAVRWP